jgi:hypothetical protein
VQYKETQDLRPTDLTSVTDSNSAVLGRSLSLSELQGFFKDSSTQKMKTNMTTKAWEILNFKRRADKH